MGLSAFLQNFLSFIGYMLLKFIALVRWWLLICLVADCEFQFFSLELTVFYSFCRCQRRPRIVPCSCCLISKCLWNCWISSMLSGYISYGFCCPKIHNSRKCCTYYLGKMCCLQGKVFSFLPDTLAYFLHAIHMGNLPVAMIISFFLLPHENSNLLY